MEALNVTVPIRAVALSVALATIVVACGWSGPTASQSETESSPLCAHLAALHTARADFVASLAAGRAGAVGEAAERAKVARDEATRVSEAIAVSGEGQSESDEPLLIRLMSVVLLIDQGALAMDGSLGGTPSASEVEHVISTTLPVLDEQMRAAGVLAITGDGSAPARCPGSSFAFEPWQDALGGPAFSPDVSALHLPASINGVPITVSTHAVSPDSLLARGVTSAGGSLTTAFVADVTAGDTLVSVLRVPGIDASTVARALGSIWPQARRSEVTIAGKPALRFDTPDDPYYIGSTTHFVVPRGDTVFLFENSDEQTVVTFMALIPG